MSADAVYRTPRPWADNVQPTPEQMAEWLRVCTAAEREDFVRSAFVAFDAQQACWLYMHVAMGDVYAALQTIRRKPAGDAA